MQCLFINLSEEEPASQRRPGGVHCVADDIMMYGVGCTDDEAVADHDTKLHALLQRCRDVGIRLHKSNIKLRQQSLTFLGHLIIIIRQPLCPVVGRRPQHAVSKLPCLVLSSAISCPSSICLGRLSTAWLVYRIFLSYGLKVVTR